MTTTIQFSYCMYVSCILVWLQPYSSVITCTSCASFNLVALVKHTPMHLKKALQDDLICIQQPYWCSNVPRMQHLEKALAIPRLTKYPLEATEVVVQEFQEQCVLPLVATFTAVLFQSLGWKNATNYGGKKGIES